MNPSKTRSMLFSLKRDKIDHLELTLSTQVPWMNSKISETMQDLNYHHRKAVNIDIGDLDC
jgi:hypothetical protein